MPRNGSGTMSIPNSFSSGSSAQASEVNANFSDVSSEITGSLPRDGQAGMTGQFKASNGTAAAPSMSFGSDTNTGFYRSAGDTIGISCGGSPVGTIGTSGLAMDAITDTSSVPYDKFPSGTPLLFPGSSTAPTGWTKSTDHDDKALRLVSGTAGTGGSVAFSTVFGLTATDAHVLTIAQMPAHNHGGGAHTHPYLKPTLGTGGDGGSSVYENASADDTNGSGVIIDTQGSNAGHSHNIDLRVQYVDTILATKD